MRKSGKFFVVVKNLDFRLRLDICILVGFAGEWNEREAVTSCPARRNCRYFVVWIESGINQIDQFSIFGVVLKPSSWDSFSLRPCFWMS